MLSLFGLDPASYRPHELHGPDRTYTETNCYTDVLIETVAAAGLDPVAMLGSAVTADFELDQWTFFKPSPEDLLRLYGLQVREMQPYRGLPGAIAARLAAGQTLMPELDAWWLPDTAGMSYRAEHVKTSVVAEAIDEQAQVFRYFHNAGYYELSGEDYRQVFRLEDVPAEVLPPYVDLIRFDGGAPAADPRATARELLTVHLARRPATNPFKAFGERLVADLPALLEGGLADYHAYAFANPRMAGCAFELLASHVRWLFGSVGEPAALALDELVGGTKLLLFRLARRRAFDAAAVVAPMVDAWDTAMGQLDVLAVS